MRRYELLEELQTVIEDQLVVCNIGIPSQELYKINDRPNYFYMLGSMGLSSSIGLGLAMNQPKTVISLEGDGAVMMNMGTLCTISENAPDNYILLIIDNGSYGSTGDQKTFTSGKVDLASMARGSGCQNVIECGLEETNDILKKAISDKKMTVIISKVKPGSEKAKPIPLHPVAIRDRVVNCINS